MKRHIPNTFTLFNLFCGSIAITFILSDSLIQALYLFVACLLFDFLDGLSARILDARSAVGKQLDSLADMVSFGIVPSIMAYKLILDTDIDEGLQYFAFIFVLAAAWRLAVFNIDKHQEASFRGLATPAAAIMVMSMPLLVYSGNERIADIIITPVMIVFVLSGLSLLMVSRIPMFALKFKTRAWDDYLPAIILGSILIVLLVTCWPIAAFFSIPAYIIISLAFGKRLRRKTS